MDCIRKSSAADVSRIAEIIISNYRINFYPIFCNEEFYFKELNVLDMAKEYLDGEVLDSTYVYDDGAVKGIVRIKNNEIEKLFVEPHFQGKGIGGKLLTFAILQKKADWLWVLQYNKRGIAFYERHGFHMTGDKIVEDECVPLLKMSLEKNTENQKNAKDFSDKTILDEIDGEKFT